MFSTGKRLGNDVAIGETRRSLDGFFPETAVDDWQDSYDGVQWKRTEHALIEGPSKFNSPLKFPLIVYDHSQAFTEPFLWVSLRIGRDIAKKDVTRNIAINKSIDTGRRLSLQREIYAYSLTASSGMPLPPFLALMWRSCSSLHWYTMWYLDSRGESPL